MTKPAPATPSLEAQHLMLACVMGCTEVGLARREEDWETQSVHTNRPAWSSVQSALPLRASHVTLIKVLSDPTLSWTAGSDLLQNKSPRAPPSTLQDLVWAGTGIFPEGKKKQTLKSSKEESGGALAWRRLRHCPPPLPSPTPASPQGNVSQPQLPPLPCCPHPGAESRSSKQPGRPAHTHQGRLSHRPQPP